MLKYSLNELVQHCSLYHSSCRAQREELTLSRVIDTAASARAFTLKGSRARQNLMELKMAMVVKAWQ